VAILGGPARDPSVAGQRIAVSVEPPIPDDESPSQPSSAEPGHGPGVGNVLGFSLLFRERRALLALVRRTLAPGVRLREYEAVIPGVRMPLRGPLMATKFRKRRCRVVRATMVVEDRALLPWLNERLVGQELLGLRIREVELDLRRELPEAEQARPCLMIAGETTAGKQVWLLIAFDLLPDQRRLLLRPCRLWLIGDLPAGLDGDPERHERTASIDREGRDTSARRLWRAIAKRLAAGRLAGLRDGLIATDDGALAIDPGRLAMTRAFASVGWKAPNLECSVLTELALSRRGVTLGLHGPLTEFEPGEDGEDEFSSARSPIIDEAAPVGPLAGEPGLLDEPIARGLDRTRELLRGSTDDDPSAALRELAGLSHTLESFPAAHLALVRWRVDLARFRDRVAALQAVREWLDLQPSAREPRRLLTLLLAAEGRAQDLARLLAADCRQPHPPWIQARLELAVASLLIDRLDDARSALTIIGPLTQRLREQLASSRDRRGSLRASEQAEPGDRAALLLAELLPEALVVLARARVAELARERRSLTTVPHVLEALEEALEHTRNPRRRADLRSRVARSFIEHGNQDLGGASQALALLSAAIADDPDDLGLLDQAIDLAVQIHERGTATMLLRMRLEAAEPSERQPLRKRLIGLASELDDREHRELARRELAIAIDQDPNDVDLLRRGAALERKLGDAMAAADYLGRLLEIDAFGEAVLDDRDAVLLDRARLLKKAGRIDEAWESLRPVASTIPSSGESLDRGSLGERAARRAWVLDILELALDLAPPTDRPRILDLLIVHARGQRRGEALVERAAQALRIHERLADLWAAVDELERPEKILAQIEQLLDDDDHPGLARLAKAAARVRERTTELHARARLGRALLVGGEPAEASEQLERALALAPDRLELRAALADCYEQLARPEHAIPHLQALLDDDEGQAGPTERGRLSLRMARLLREIGELDQAASLLSACEQELSEADPELVDPALRDAIAEQSFAALRELAEDVRALTIAIEHATALLGQPDHEAQLGAWLARAARVLDEAGVESLTALVPVRAESALPDDRIALLERAVALRPDDAALADELELALRERGDVEGLERHLRGQIERHGDPELRAGLLERLIGVIEQDEALDRRHDELAELLEDLLVLRPEHTTAMLILGNLRFEQGDQAQARQLWAVASERLDDDDPRFARPALVLARHALETGEPEQARTLVERSLRLEPDDADALELLGAIAEEIDDPELAAAAAAGRLALLDERESDEQRADLEFAGGRALARTYEREREPAIGQQAIDAFARAERLAPARVRTIERAAATRTWLSVARALGELGAQARARAVLRETAGVEIDLPELLAEVELLVRLDRPGPALERLEALLARPTIEAAVITVLGELLASRRESSEWTELATRAARGLRVALSSRSRSAGREPAAMLAIELGRTLEDPAIVAFGLDQLDPERVERGELAELREWAIRRLGRVHEEQASVEARLLAAGLPTARREGLVARLLALHDGDHPVTAGRLLVLAEQAEREVAASLADAALELLSPATLEQIELSLDALTVLARHGARERLLARWPALEQVVAGGGEIATLERLLALASELEQTELRERADALLRERLIARPGDARLIRALWLRCTAEQLVVDDEQPHAATVERAAAWLSALLHERELPAASAGELFEGLAVHVAAVIDEASAVALLREQAEARLDDAPVFAELLARIQQRRRWSDVLGLLGKASDRGLELAAGVEPWLRVAEAASEDREVDSEVRARARAGSMLLRAAGLIGEATQVDGDSGGAALQGIAELRRALDLAPGRADLRWRLGRAQAILHARTPDPALARDALACLLPLWDQQRWSDAGVEAAELALRCGELASELGDHERAAELLGAAHARVAVELRERTGALLFASLVALGREDDAVQLASARAAELETVDQQVVWLRRAAERASGQREVELLQRARELAPQDESLLAMLEVRLRALDDQPALEQLAQERLDRFRTRARIETGLELDEIDPQQLDEGLRTGWIASLRARIALLPALPGRDGDDETEHDDSLGELVPLHEELHEELLRLDPDDGDALMTLAGQRMRAGEIQEALALWTRAESGLRDDDPRLFEVAKRLAEQRLQGPPGRIEREDLLDAHRLLERALSLRPSDPEALARRHAIACMLDDPPRVLVAARALLEQSVGLDHHQLAELEGDVARAQALLGHPLEAIAAFERAVASTEPGSERHRELAQRWIELLDHPQLSDAEPAIRARRELAARTELRLALGTELSGEQTLREADLLLELGELDPALGLIEGLLIQTTGEAAGAAVRGRARGWLDRLAGSEQGRHRDRVLRSQRRVVDALPSGRERDQLARELALSARAAEAARTTLDALDRLSGQAAAEPELLDLRVWAVRKLDRVEDELAELDRLLTEPSDVGDPVLLDRLLRLLEHDIEACAGRLIDLAGSTSVTAHGRKRVWLLDAALDLLQSHVPDRLLLGVRALTGLLELIGDPTVALELDGEERAARERVAGLRRHWQQFAASALEQATRDRRALERVVELVHAADRAAASELPGFVELGEMLLDRASVDFPDHPGLHALARRRLPEGDARLALERIDRLATSHRIDARGRARLYLGLVGTLALDQQPGLLRELAARHLGEPAIFALLREALRKLGAFTELVELIELGGELRAEVDPDRWLELAEDAAAAERSDIEAEARARAGSMLLARVLADERDTGALTDTSSKRAVEQLARAHTLRPDDRQIQLGYGRALERAGQPAAALEQLAPLIDVLQAEPDATFGSLGPLARRCGLLAIELGERERAVEFLDLARHQLEQRKARLTVAERLYKLLVELARNQADEPRWNQRAALLAREIAESLGDTEESLAWLERAARLAGDEHERAELLARAHALRPDDDRLADAYEASLRALDDRPRLQVLLRARIQAGLHGGDRARTVGQLERLLALLAKPTSNTEDRVAVIRDRAELLEQLLRLAPDRLEARLELADLRLAEGDREAALGHWRQLAERLPADDPRFSVPARELARFALEADDLDQARRWLERALKIDANDASALAGLVDLGRRTNDAPLLLRASQALLDHPTADVVTERAELQRQRASAFERLERPDEALVAIRQAAGEAEPMSRLHVEIAEQWLRLVTREGKRVLLRENEDAAQATGEAEARAELRFALDERLPARAYVTEAELLATRLGRRSDALELLTTGLRRHPSEPDLLAALEELCASAGEQARFVELLAALLAERSVERSAEDPAPPIRLIEKLARAARAIDDPTLCLRALESLPGELAERSELLELRDWAIRGLGRVEGELDEIDRRLLALDDQSPPERLQALVGRMLRLLGEAGEPCAERLLALIQAHSTMDLELARVLARSALRVAREYAPERLGIAIAALRATLIRDSSKAAAAWWSGVESLALDSGAIGPIVELLGLVPRSGELGSVDRLALAAARIDPGSRELHDALVDRLPEDQPEIAACEQLDALARELDLQALGLAQLWTSGLASLDRRFAEHTRSEPASAWITAILRERTERAIDDREAFTGLLELLRERGRWSDVLDLALLAGDRIGGPPSAMLDDIADRASRANDAPTRLRARVQAGLRLRADREPALAADAFADALTVAPDRLDLQYRLGEALREAGRADAALERLLPLVDHPQLDALAELLGDEPTLDRVTLIRRCADLLHSVGQRERATTLLDRALAACPIDDVRRPELVEQLFVVLVELDLRERAAALAHTATREHQADPELRLRWLLRVAEHGDAAQQLDALSEIHILQPDDEALTGRLEQALLGIGEHVRLSTLLRERVEQARRIATDPQHDAPTRALARTRGAEALRRLLVLVPVDANANATAELWEQLLEFEPDDVEALLTLADLRSTDKPESAAALWRRAGNLLPLDDDRFYAPALALAHAGIERREFVESRALLDRALQIRPGDHDVLEQLRELALASHDPRLGVRAIVALLDQPQRAGERAELELELALAHAALAQQASELHDPHEARESSKRASASFERAASRAEPGSDLHRRIARAALDVALERSASLERGELTVAEGDRRLALEHEASARVQLRAAFGSELPNTELRIEASLLARGLDRVDEGLALLEQTLAEQPNDSILLSTYKDLALAGGLPARYADMLEVTIALLGEREPETRDRLATELAFTAVELDDAPRLLAQLDRMSPGRVGSPELLDLREWAIRKLGRVELELGEIDQELLAVAVGDETEPLVARLLRMLEHDYGAAAERLLALSRQADPLVARTLRVAMLELARSAEPSAIAPLLAALPKLVTESPPASELVEHWPAIEKLALEHGEPGELANLIEIGRSAVEHGLPGLSERVVALHDLALLSHPESPDLHALHWDPFEGDVDKPTRLAKAEALLDTLTDRLRAKGRVRARLCVGLAQLFDRRDGAELLVRRGRLELEDPEAFAGIVDALESGNHWNRAIELLGHRAEHAVHGRDDEQRVADLKQLAHLYADVLGDPDMAIVQLERALALAPADPDLMLPLLDHYYGQPQLERAIELSMSVLDHVPMGAVAFAALGHRAADAALASGRHDFAEQLLRRILTRAPDESRTRDRLRELEDLADDPEHRVRMLAAIANRTSGSARVEALEERARLLVTPLGRLEEAIADLESVTEEAAGRARSVDLLASLYEQRQRWTALVSLLGREYPRQQGLDRVRTLRRIAELQRSRLDDLPRAEQALRLALENLDDLSLDGLAEQLPDEREPKASVDDLADELHLELVTVLDKHGRYSDLIAHLEHELADDLAGRSDPRERGQAGVGWFDGPVTGKPPRIELLQRLARALRDHSEDGERTARCYARLEQIDALPDEGLATLARWYRGHQRYDDLVRILTVRSRKLAEIGDADRKAEADFRIGELLEGPLRRPHEAARFFLDAYLANPADNPTAGARARVLLAGTDSVVNVRNRLLMRLTDLRESYKPALLTLLGDLLAPHDEFETESERRYREALHIAPTLAAALEGLGRLLSRQGRIEEAIEPLTLAARSPDISDDRAADDAASAARALIELDRTEEAESVLQRALVRAPESQRALLELARLYERLDRKPDEAIVLERLAELSLSSNLRAEVGYRQAMLLAKQFRTDPMSEAGEKARALLLEAVGADAMHAQARQTLLELAGARSEWSIVAHMHFLAIRELPPGPRRALTHLDLAETYLDRLSDAQSSIRNLAAAIQVAPLDVVVLQRANTLAHRLPDLGDAAERLEHFARNPARPELGETFDDAARARLLMLASDLHLRNDALEPAERTARAATEFADLGDVLRRQAELHLEQIIQIDQGEFDLRKRRKALLAKLDDTVVPNDRLQLLGRLRETARALGDRDDLEAATNRQLDLAHELLAGNDLDLRDTAIACLRDLFAESGEYGRIVNLYEELAARTGDPNEAAERLTAAARFAWSGLRDPKLAVAIVRRALDRAPTHAPATALLGEIAGASDEREVDATICDELSLLAPRQRPPLLTLRLAEAALRLERREQAQGVLRQLLAGEASVELRLQALSLLDGLLESAGRTHDRIPLLEERLELCRRHWPDRAADIALELARAQRGIGNLQDARATCRTALLDKPSDQPLTKLYAELLEQAEDWSALARALEQLANLTIETREQAHWLTRAAQVHLDHGSDARESLPAARRLLERARAVSIESTEARAVLLPLAFHQGDWERVLELAIELRSIAGDEHEALVYAALTEAFSRGKRTLARSIGDRHDKAVRARILWPTSARMLDLIAFDGPLPRLDAVLAAAAALCGGTEELLDELGAWAAGQPLGAGLALGLARLNEAFRRMELARHLYQIAAYMAPGGPVPVLTTRLPVGELPENPLQREDWVPLEWRGALRDVLMQLRGDLAGLRASTGGARAPRKATERTAIQLATRISGAWRGRLGVDIAILATDDRPPGGVGLRNLERPTIVVSEDFVNTPEAERAYRLAYAAAALATGLGPLVDDHPLPLIDLVDALLGLSRPRHVARGEEAQNLADQFAARGLTATKLDGDLRRALARELDHWRSGPAKLERVVHRACMLIGTRLSGQVDGALMAMARDRGLTATQGGRGVDPAVLETTDAAWLLRALGVFGGE
jgi:tetratricopeptide (TPR) repeat protein